MDVRDRRQNAAPIRLTKCLQRERPRQDSAVWRESKPAFHHPASVETTLSGSVMPESYRVALHGTHYVSRAARRSVLVNGSSRYCSALRSRVRMKTSAGMPGYS